MEIQLKFQWIPVEISMKHRWKSIEITVEISMKFKWKSIGYPVSEFNSNFNGIPVGSTSNPVEILNDIQMEISMKCQNKLIGNPVAIQWNTNGNPVEISMEYQWESIKNQVEFSMRYQWKLNEIQA